MIKRDDDDDHPFLATLAVRRTESTSELPGRYCRQQDVWVVDGPQGPIPIITSHQADSVAPMTKIKGERPESEGSVTLELSTKTAVQLERDDLSPRTFGSLRKRDTKVAKMLDQDTSSHLFLLELSTKTETRRERDDR